MSLWLVLFCGVYDATLLPCDVTIRLDEESGGAVEEKACSCCAGSKPETGGGVVEQCNTLFNNGYRPDNTFRYMHHIDEKVMNNIILNVLLV